MTEGGQRVDPFDDPTEVQVTPTTGVHLVVVFNGPGSARMRYTRKGVTSEMLAAAAAMLRAMADVELESQHAATLEQMMQRAQVGQIAVPGRGQPPPRVKRKR